jgi:hypothetical protein
MTELCKHHMIALGKGAICGKPAHWLGIPVGMKGLAEPRCEEHVGDLEPNMRMPIAKYVNKEKG